MLAVGGRVRRVPLDADRVALRRTERLRQPLVASIGGAADPERLDVEPSRLGLADRHSFAVPVDDDLGVEQLHDRVEVLRLVGLLGSTHEPPRTGLGVDAQQLAGEVERRSLVGRIDEHAGHADVARTLDARGCVVEEHDLRRVDAEDLRRAHVRLGERLGLAELAGIDERVERLELRAGVEELLAGDPDAVVGEHGDLEAGLAGVVHQRHRFRVGEPLRHRRRHVAVHQLPVVVPVRGRDLVPIADDVDLARHVAAPDRIAVRVEGAAAQTGPPRALLEVVERVPERIRDDITDVENERLVHQAQVSTSSTNRHDAFGARPASSRPQACTTGGDDVTCCVPAWTSRSSRCNVPLRNDVVPAER